jgi:hypothetical protein
VSTSLLYIPPPPHLSSLGSRCSCHPHSSRSRHFVHLWSSKKTNITFIASHSTPTSHHITFNTHVITHLHNVVHYPPTSHHIVFHTHTKLAQCSFTTHPHHITSSSTLMSQQTCAMLFTIHPHNITSRSTHVTPHLHNVVHYPITSHHNSTPITEPENRTPNLSLQTTRHKPWMKL